MLIPNVHFYRPVMLLIELIMYLHWFLGAGIPTAGLASPGVLPFTLRANGMAAVPLAGHSMLTPDGHVVSPQALQLVVLWSFHLFALYFLYTFSRCCCVYIYFLSISCPPINSQTELVKDTMALYG